MTVNSSILCTPPSGSPVTLCTHRPPSASSVGWSSPLFSAVCSGSSRACSPNSGSLAAAPYSYSQSSVGKCFRGIDTLNVRWTSSETWSGEQSDIRPAKAIVKIEVQVDRKDRHSLIPISGRQTIASNPTLATRKGQSALMSAVWFRKDNLEWDRTMPLSAGM